VNRKMSRQLPEVLIVGLVVIVVALIMMRTYFRSMAQAHRVACLSNLSQVGQALSMYRTDYDQCFPPGPGWHRGLLPYIGGRTENALLLCPAATDIPGYGYGLDHVLGGVMEGRISTPTEAVMLADVRRSTDAVWWVNDIRFGRLERNRIPDPRHIAKANFAFCDGHVRSEDPDRLTEGNWRLAE
jgi:prepilin-type processing-associated H-X9-DG protein